LETRARVSEYPKARRRVVDGKVNYMARPPRERRARKYYNIQAYI